MYGVSSSKAQPYQSYTYPEESRRRRWSKVHLGPFQTLDRSHGIRSHGIIFKRGRGDGMGQRTVHVVVDVYMSAAKPDSDRFAWHHKGTKYTIRKVHIKKSTGNVFGRDIA